MYEYWYEYIHIYKLDNSKSVFHLRHLINDICVWFRSFIEICMSLKIIICRICMNMMTDAHIDHHVAASQSGIYHLVAEH